MSSRRRRRIQGHKADMLDALAAEAGQWEQPEDTGTEWLEARDELIRQVYAWAVRVMPADPSWRDETS